MKIGWTALGLPLCSRPLRAYRRRRLPASPESGIEISIDSDASYVAQYNF
jgi:hypothetical protein